MKKNIKNICLALCGAAVFGLGSAAIINVQKANAGTELIIPQEYVFEKEYDYGNILVVPEPALVRMKTGGVETTAVADIADVDKSKRVAALGEGGAISLMDRSTIYDKELINLALDIAKENGIKAQVKKFVSGGNDAGHIHKSGTGVRALALSAPTRYLHSPNCVSSYDDYQSMLNLLYKFILTEKLN